MELLEREAALNALSTALYQPDGGRVLLISGEAGIGKTTLLARFTRTLAGGWRPLWGACDALFTPRPLGALHDIAAQTRGELADLLAKGADRQPIFTACLDELRKMPTVAIFEDIHWADEATLDLLKYLGRRIGQTRALLIATFRDDELDPRHPVRLLLGDLATAAAARRLELAPLSLAAVRQLAGNQPVDAALLHNRTGGNPFFVSELLAAGMETTPPTVREAILARTARLSLSGQAVLNLAAVIGSRVEPWLLADAASAEAAAVDECLATGLLRSQEEFLAFRHELSRQTILDDIPAHQRPGLHRVVLDALRLSPIVHSDPARLAYHAAEAGDGDAVMAFAPRAAALASRSHARRSAAALYALAIRFADRLPPGEQAELHLALATELEYSEQRVECLVAYQRAASLWQAAGDLEQYARCLAFAATIHQTLGQIEEAVKTNETSIEVLEELPLSPTILTPYRNRAMQALYRGDTPAAIRAAEKTLDLAQRWADPVSIIRAYNTISLSLFTVDPKRSRDYLEKGLALSLAQGIDGAIAAAYGNLTLLYADDYLFERAEELVKDGLAFTASHDLDLVRYFLIAWGALIHVYRGNWSKAEEILGEQLPRAELNPNIQVPLWVAAGRLQARRGEVSPGAALDQALAQSRRAGNQPRINMVYTARAEAAWLAGDTKRVRQEVASGYEIALDSRHAWFAGELIYWGWRAGEVVNPPAWIAAPYALQIAGDWQGAAAAWERLGCPYEQGRALAEGDAAGQTAALAIFERLGAAPAAAAVRAALRAAGAPLPRKPNTTTRENPFGLTRRQLEILELLGQDLTNAEIASRLHISAKTVDHHVSAVLARLEVPSRWAAATFLLNHPELFPTKK